MNKAPRLMILIFLVIFLLIPCADAANETQDELFFKANQAYDEGRYKNAVSCYQKLLESGKKSGHIYYNLGNAYIRQNKLGKAIVNYKSAQILIPRDPDLNFNLRYAEEQSQDAVHNTQSFLDMIFIWLHSFNLKEFFWAFAIINACLWSVLMVRLFSKLEWTYYFAIVFLILWLITGVSFGSKWYQVMTDNRAVVLEKEVDILAGPDTRDTVLFRLHEGTTVHIERTEDNWCLIHLSDTKRGWMKAEALEQIQG